ncbi:hypothetical protein CF319_g7724 [Tilletia indica]|nr:hypothetical protein CF319_g7724 [Tilletia indica]
MYQQPLPPPPFDPAFDPALLQNPAIQAAITAARHQNQQQQQPHAPIPTTQQAQTSQLSPPTSYAGSSSTVSDPALTPTYLAAQALDKKKSVWTREIAQEQALAKRKEKAKERGEDEDAKQDDRYSKEDIMRDHEGNPCSKARIKEMDTVTRLACAAIDEHDFDPPLAPAERTFRNLKTAAMALLIKIAKRMEEQCEELKYGDHHYKAFLFIELHLRHKNEGRRRVLKATTKAGSRRLKKSSTSSNSKASSHATSSKTTLSENDYSEDSDRDQPRKKKTKQRASGSANTSSKASSSAKPSGPSKDDEFSEASDSGLPPKKKAKVLTPVERLNALAKAPNQTRTVATKLVTKAIKTHAAVFAGPSQLSTPVEKINALARKDDDTGTAAKQSVSVSTGTTSQSTNKLPNPTLAAIRDYLDLRCGDLESHTQVRDALKVLQDFVNFGSDSNGPGKESFMTWLVALEILQETPEDEDNHGSSFGHDAIGRYAYRDELKTIDDFGCVRNACRLLAALLKIWTTSAAQIRASDNHVHGPVSGTHVHAISVKIANIFKLPTRSNPYPMSKTTSNTETSATAGASAGPSTTTDASPTKQVKEVRNRISKELDSGTISDAALRSLSKKMAVALLEQNDMTVSGRASKEDVLDALVSAYRNKKIALTAAKVKAARANIVQK